MEPKLNLQGDTPLNATLTSSQTSQPTTQPNQSNGQLDPKVIQLAKSIRQVESNNNFNAIGDQGTSKGAYQFHNNNFENWAKQYGLDPNDLSPENQNKVAYNKIKDWKDQGYQPGEIAAMWNGSHLENGRPVANNPSYVQKVKQAYDSQNGNGYLPIDNTPVIPNSKPQQTPQQGNGDIGGFFSNLLKPELTGVASGIRSIQSIPSVIKESYGLATGNQDLANQGATESQQTVTKPLFGINTLEGNDVQQNLGLATQTIGQALGFSPVALGIQTLGSDINQKKGLVQTGVDTGSTILGAKVLGLLSPSLGKFAGGLFEALPQGMQDTVSASGQAIKSGLNKLGEMINPTLDKLTPDFLQKSVSENLANSPLGTKYLSDLKDNYNELFTGSKKATKGLLISLAKGDDPAAFGAGGNPNGKAYIPDTVKTPSGSIAINAKPTVDEVVKDVQPFEQQFKGILNELDKNPKTADITNLEDLRTQAKEMLNTSRARGSGTLPEQQKGVDDIINNLKQTYGDTVTRTQLNEIRSGQWSESNSFNPNRPNFMKDVNYMVGKSAKNTLMNKVSDTPVAKKLLDSIGDHYDFGANLNRIDGKVLGGQSIGKITNKLIGTVIGSHFGLPGEIMGNVIGGSIGDLQANAQISNPVKRAILSSIPPSSALYDEAQNAIKQLINENVTGQLETKALPSPSAIQMPHQTPPQGSSLDILNAKKGLPGRNPKTGRMFKTYSSEGILPKLIKEQ